MRNFYHTYMIQGSNIELCTYMHTMYSTGIWYWKYVDVRITDSETCLEYCSTRSFVWVPVSTVAHFPNSNMDSFCGKCETTAQALFSETHLHTSIWLIRHPFEYSERRSCSLTEWHCWCNDSFADPSSIVLFEPRRGNKVERIGWRNNCITSLFASGVYK